MSLQKVETTSHNTTYKPSYCALLIGILAFIAFQTTSAAWFEDSIVYAYIWPDSDSGILETPHISSFGDIVESQYNHYLTRNGRAPVHVLVQIFCGLTSSHIPFIICNTLVWGALICLFIKSLKTRAGSAWQLLLSFMLLELVTPPHYDPAFQINYIWVAAGYLIWFAIFYRTLKQTSDAPGNPSKLQRIRRIITYVAVFLFSFLIGWSNEAFSFPILGALILFSATKKLKSDTLQQVMIIGAVLGALMILCSPGSWNRMRGASYGSIFNRFAFEIIYSWVFWILIIMLGFNKKTDKTENQGLYFRK